MKLVISISATLLALAGVVLMPACSSLHKAPDPQAIEQQVAAARSEELELVRATIQDPERAERLIELLAERDRLIAGYTDEIEAHRRKMTALNADYHSQRADFEALLTKFNQRRAESQKELVDLIYSMKQTTTAEEWKTIANFQLKRLHLRSLTYGAVSAGG